MSGDKDLSREVTPPSTYFNRRTLLRGGLIAGSAAASALIYQKLNGVDLRTVDTAELAGLVPATTPPYTVDEPMTPLAGVTNYNNFYEFTTNKDKVAEVAAGFKTEPWQLAVDGLCAKPRVFDLDDIRKLAPPEERIYRMRCVEGWSMVVPWAGISLSKLLAAVQPLGDAKFVAFTTLLDPERMPGQKGPALQWPYVEGLRIDEAMHPLTLLAQGLYGRILPPQNGAPLRIIIPWKYGFKGIKSIVKVSLVAEQPVTSWSRYNSREYGFYGNVNPAVDHPRWTQASEMRIGTTGRRPTLPFNGYADQVASLYSGMDLRVSF